jgi:alkylation response protein AidB-like acyl-CoA dehydrogenase
VEAFLTSALPPDWAPKNITWPGGYGSHDFKGEDVLETIAGYRKNLIEKGCNIISEAAARVTRFSHQMHGAIAFCDEPNLHFYYRKVKAAGLTFGDGEYHLEKGARSLGL